MHWFESRNWTYWQCSWCCCRSGDYVHTSVWHQRRCAVFLKWIIKWFCLESLNICNTSIRRFSCRWTSSQLSPEGGSPHLTLEPELSGHSSTALDYCFVQLKYKIYEYFFFSKFLFALGKTQTDSWYQTLTCGPWKGAYTYQKLNNQTIHLCKSLQGQERVLLYFYFLEWIY